MAGGPLTAGDRAPDFALPGDRGEVRLGDLLSAGPAVLAFFKTTCPTCRMAFPVLGQIEDRFSSDIPVVGVGQDPLAAARSWCD